MAIHIPLARSSLWPRQAAREAEGCGRQLGSQLSGHWYVSHLLSAGEDQQTLWTTWQPRLEGSTRKESFPTTQGLILCIHPKEAILAPQTWESQISGIPSTIHRHQPPSTKDLSDKMSRLPLLSTTEYQPTQKWADQGPEGAAQISIPIEPRIPGRRTPWLQPCSWTPPSSAQPGTEHIQHHLCSAYTLRPSSYRESSMVQIRFFSLKLQHLTTNQKEWSRSLGREIRRKRKDRAIKTKLSDIWNMFRIVQFTESGSWTGK